MPVCKSTSSQQAHRNAASAEVLVSKCLGIYRSKFHVSLKRNYQLLAATQWLKGIGKLTP